MHDMLVRLYDLPSLEDALEAASGRGVTIRPALPLEMPVVLGWMRSNFDVWTADISDGSGSSRMGRGVGIPVLRAGRIVP